MAYYESCQIGLGARYPKGWAVRSQAQLAYACASLVGGAGAFRIIRAFPVLGRLSVGLVVLSVVLGAIPSIIRLGGRSLSERSNFRSAHGAVVPTKHARQPCLRCRCWCTGGPGSSRRRRGATRIAMIYVAAYANSAGARTQKYREDWLKLRPCPNSYHQRYQFAPNAP